MSQEGVLTPYRQDIRGMAISDVHVTESINELYRLKTSIAEARHAGANVLILAGDIISKHASEATAWGVAHILGEEARDKDGNIRMQTLYVWGNDEEQMEESIKESYAGRLKQKGITVFRNGQNNVAFIKNPEGKEVATIVGMPWTITGELYQRLLKLPEEEFADLYTYIADSLHTPTFMQDLATAKEKGLPTYIVFHASPYPHDWILESTRPDDVRRSVVIDLLNRPESPDIVGCFYGHTNTQGVLSVRDGIVFVGLCEEVVNREGKRMLEFQFIRRRVPLEDARVHFASQFDSAKVA